MSLDANDLKKIHSTFVDAFDELWKGGLEPTLNKILMELDSKPSTHHLNAQVNHLEETLSERAVEPSIRRDRTLNDKTNAVARKLANKTVFTETDVKEVERISPLAVNPTV